MVFVKTMTRELELLKELKKEGYAYQNNSIPTKEDRRRQGKELGLRRDNKRQVRMIENCKTNPIKNVTLGLKIFKAVFFNIT